MFELIDLSLLMGILLSSMTSWADFVSNWKNLPNLDKFTTVVFPLNIAILFMASLHQPFLVLAILLVMILRKTV